MKKLLFLFLTLAVTALGMAAETVTLSGKIANMDGRALKIEGVFLNKEINLKPDGSFNETFAIEHSGVYILLTPNNRIDIYLKKDSKIVVIADAKDFYKTIKYTGELAADNQYLAASSQKIYTIPFKEWGQLDEEGYLKKVGEITNAISADYKTTHFTDETFKTAQLRNIGFIKTNLINDYEGLRKAVSKNKDFKTSASFPKPEAIVTDNTQDWLFSTAYRELCSSQFYAEITAPNVPVIDAATGKPFEAALKYKSTVVRDMILEGFSYDVALSNPNFEKLYQTLMAAVTSQNIKNAITDKYKKIKFLVLGMPSPVFDYENYKGGKTSLTSLKGKYVYIDVWATWCGPCREEIPSLQKVEEEFKGRNIEFVSIAVDAPKNHQKWANMIAEKQMGGLQLFADKEWDSEFIKSYVIESIPRFILIDPSGNIINADAPRPSDPTLLTLLGGLQI